MTLPLAPSEGLGEARFYFSSPSAPLGLDMVIPLDSTSAQSQEPVRMGRRQNPGIMDHQKGPWSLVGNSQAGPPAAHACCTADLGAKEFLMPHAL